MTRIAIVQPYIPTYRVTFFTRLREVLQDDGIQLVVAHGEVRGRPAERGDSVALHDGLLLPARKLRLLGRELIYRGIDSVRHPDLLILEQALGNLEGYWPLLGPHRRWPRVALWGHGRTYTHPVARRVDRAKTLLTNRADWFLAYTKGGAGHVVAHGFPADRVTVVNNSVDTEAITEARHNLTEAQVSQFIERHELTHARPVAFIGALDRSKRLDFLLSALAEVRREMPEVVLVVAGDGPDRALIQSAREGVRYVGRAGPVEKAIIARIAPLLVCPGRVGLVAVDSFAMGTPIVTTSWPYHAPEFEYLEHGRSAWITPDDATSFARELVALLRDEERLEQLEAGCTEALPSHSLGAMVSNFASGIQAALGR